MLISVFGGRSIGPGDLRHNGEVFVLNLSEFDGSEWKHMYLQMGEAGSKTSISEFMSWSFNRIIL